MDGEALKADFKAVRNSMPEQHRVRLWRAISWYQCAEGYSEDHDISFITLWIALNACYAISATGLPDNVQEQVAFQRLAEKLVKLDKQGTIYDCLRRNYSKLVDNKFLFKPFFKAQADDTVDWECLFASDKKDARTALALNHPTATATALGIVLDRLYLLRNQLVHGAATYNSKLNRDQIIDGKNMLMELLPIIIRLMFDHTRDWGPIPYFPIEDTP